MQAAGWAKAGPGKHAADLAESRSCLLLLHILAQVPRSEQWATGEMIFRIEWGPCWCG